MPGCTETSTLKNACTMIQCSYLKVSGCLISYSTLVPHLFLDSLNLLFMFPYWMKAPWKRRDRNLTVAYSTHDQDQECQQERGWTQLSPLLPESSLHKTYKFMILCYILICMFVHCISLLPPPQNVNSLKTDYYFCSLL